MEYKFWEMGSTLTFELEDIEKLQEKGIIGLESAVGYWGYSSYAWTTFPVLVFETYNSELFYPFGGSIKYVGIPRNITEDDYVITKEGYSIMKPEVAICDMIEFDADMFHTLEAIDKYMCFADDTAPLEELAKQRGIYDKLIEYAEIAAKDFEEQ